MSQEISREDFIRLLNLLNSRHLRITRDGYPEQSFMIQFHLRSKDEHLVELSAFNSDLTIEMDLKNLNISVTNARVPNVVISHTLLSHYDMCLYVMHTMLLLSNDQTNNPMLVLTILPTLFTTLLKAYEDLPDGESNDFVGLVSRLLDHTRDICFDSNSIIHSKVKV